MGVVMAIHFLDIPQVVIQPNVAGYSSQSVLLPDLTLGELAHVEDVFEPDLALILLELRIDTGSIVNFFESVKRQYEYIGQAMKVESLDSVSFGLALGTLPFVFDHLFLAVHLQAIFNARLNEHHFLLGVVRVVDSCVGVQLTEVKILVVSYLNDQRTLRLEIVLIVSLYAFYFSLLSIWLPDYQIEGKGRCFKGLGEVILQVFYLIIR